MEKGEDTTTGGQVKHEHRTYGPYKPRGFDAASLEQIDAEIRKGPFDDVNWELRHEQVHVSRSLKALLEQVPIAQVTSFRVHAGQHLRRGSSPLEWETAYLDVDQRYCYWSATEGADVEGARLAARRVLDFIQTLPRSGWKSKFGSPPRPISSRLKRPPEGLREWFQMGAAIAVVGGVILTVLKATGAF